MTYSSSILVCLWVYFLVSVVVLWGLLTLFHVTCIVQFVIFRLHISSHFSLWTQDFLGVAATISGRAYLGIFKGQILHCVFSGKFKKDWMKCRWRLQAPENNIENPIWCRPTTKLFWFGLVEAGALAETVSLGCNCSTVGAGGGEGEPVPVYLTPGWLLASVTWPILTLLLLLTPVGTEGPW